MKTILHPAAERGYADHGWLQSYHSFSFAGFHDPSKMHFGALRVLNDDTVAPGYGFGTHPHDNMEIVSIPLYGDLHHKDSTGRDKIIAQGDVQIMSTGSGIQHSEKNAHHDKEVKFLQIWIFPKEKNIEPRYEQKSFSLQARQNRWQTVVAPNDPEALWINQDAWFTLGNMETGTSLTYDLHLSGNGVYVFMIDGEVNIAGQLLTSRNALGIWETASVQISAQSDSTLLLIEVPMVF